VLMRELESYAPVLASRRRILVGTKLDLEEAGGRLDAFRAANPGEEVYGISVFSGEGLDGLREAMFGLVASAEAAAGEDADGDEDLFGLEEEDSPGGGP
jgi:GTPase